jgi:hypothetical protein
MASFGNLAFFKSSITNVYKTVYEKKKLSKGRPYKWFGGCRKA